MIHVASRNFKMPIINHILDKIHVRSSYLRAPKIKNGNKGFQRWYIDFKI